METDNLHGKQLQNQLDSVSATQKQIYHIIEKQPGLNITEIASIQNCTGSTAKHHLHALEHVGLIITEWDGRAVRHYLPHHYKNPEVRIHALLTDERNKRVYDFLAENNTDLMSINKIANQLDLNFNTLLGILRHMEKENLILLKKVNGRYRQGVEKRSLFHHVQPQLLEDIVQNNLPDENSLRADPPRIG